MIGLDIGSTAVRAVQLKTARRGPTLERIGQVLLPHGVVRDGEIVDSDTVVEALRTLWKTYKFAGRKVALGVANQQVVVRQVDLPYLEEDELRQSLSFQVQDHIPIPLDQAVLDFQVLENYELEDGRRMSRILLVAAQKSMVDKLVNVAQRAKLEPVGLDLDAFAVLRSLAPEPGSLNGDDDGELLIDVGANVTNIIVHQNGTPRFVRILLMGGGSITDALVGGLDLEFEEAEVAKATYDPEDRGDDAGRVIRDRAARFVDEIRGSVDYYVAQRESVPVARAVLSGGAGLLPHLREQLAEVLRVPVEYGEPTRQLTVGKVGLSEDEMAEAEPFLTVAVGLALGVGS